MNRSTRFFALAALLLCAAPVLAEGPLRFFPITPCRVADTRLPAYSPAIGGNTSRDFTVQGVCGIPVNAKAVALNATIINPGTDGYLTLYPSNVAKPLAASMTFRAGEPALGNGAIVGLAPTTPDLKAFVFQGLNSFSAHLALDATGYFCKVDAGGACIP
jgi:hypothetical protein